MTSSILSETGSNIITGGNNLNKNQYRPSFHIESKDGMVKRNVPNCECLDSKVKHHGFDSFIRAE